MPRTAKPIRHGTYSGWNQHQKRGVPMCVACREAARQKQAEYREDPEVRSANRLRIEAGKLARRELAVRHATEYRQLYKFYKQQLARLEKAK